MGRTPSGSLNTLTLERGVPDEHLRLESLHRCVLVLRKLHNNSLPTEMLLKYF